MRGKKAKALRRKAWELELEFIKQRVLTAEMFSDTAPEHILKVLPRSSLLRRDNCLQQAFGTKRWFIRAVKMNPSLTYQEISEVVYGVK